jgi:hypothetical protein
MTKGGCRLLITDILDTSILGAGVATEDALTMWECFPRTSDKRRICHLDWSIRLEHSWGKSAKN